MGADFWIVLRWWGTLFFVGAIAFPVTKNLFKGWWDSGYLFAKAVGMALVTYLVYIFGIYHVLPFTQLSVWISMGIVFFVGLWITVLNNESGIPSASLRAGMNHGKRDRTIIPASSAGRHNSFFIIRPKGELVKQVSLIFSEEIFFFLALLFWSWVKAHEPSIHGLEKFMDYGFMKSILNSRYFPAPDIWYAGFPINYYYFGHTVVAVLTRLSGIELSLTFNLMLATLFAFTATMSASIAYQLLGHIEHIRSWLRITGTIVTAYIVTLGGNLQTLYAVTKGYTGDSPPPFWTLFWKFSELGRINEGLDRYWYANATRFIPFTIHEFPSYSFVVSDLHGHVLSLPFVLLAIAMLIQMFAGQNYGEDTNIRIYEDTNILRYKDKKRLGYKDIKSKIHRLLSSSVSQYSSIVFYGLLVAILLMTNALDGPIYGGLFVLIVLFFETKTPLWSLAWWEEKLTVITVMAVSAVVASVPFMQHFSSVRCRALLLIVRYQCLRITKSARCFLRE